MTLTRRTCLAALAAAPVLANAGWRDGPRRGFVLGLVDRRPALLDAMAAYGATVARVFLRFAADGEGFRLPLVDVHRLRALLVHAQRLGMTLIVAAEFEGAGSPAFWHDAARRAGFVAAWRELARKLGDDPALAGLDLLNEPVPPMPSGDPREAQALWRPLAAQVIAALRDEGLAIPVLFEPAPGGNVMGLAALEPFADPQVVYSIHFYTPHDITHQGVSPTWSRRIPYPATAAYDLGGWDRELGRGAIDTARIEAELRPARDFVRRHGAVLHVGEFSCVRWAPDGSAARWIADCLAVFEREGWSWTYHEFRGWPGWDAEIASTEPGARTRSSDAPVITLLRDAMARRR